MGHLFKETKLNPLFLLFTLQFKCNPKSVQFKPRFCCLQIVAYRILLTLPVSVATGERSFSKLKLIKNFLRSTMLQERLSNLAIISIEKDVAKSLNYDDIIDEFALLKARKCNFE